MYLVNWAQESSNNSSCYDISVFRADIFVVRSEPDWKAYANEAISVKKNTSCDKKATDERFYLGSTSILSTMVRTLLKIRKGLTAGGQGWNVVGVGGWVLFWYEKDRFPFDVTSCFMSDDVLLFYMETWSVVLMF